MSKENENENDNENENENDNDMNQKEISEQLMADLRSLLAEGLTGIAIIARMDEDSPLPEITFIAAPIQHFHMHIATIAACYLALDTAIENIANDANVPPEGIVMQMLMGAWVSKYRF